MKKDKKKLILLGIVLLVLPFFSAFQIDSANYGTNSVLSSGGVNVSSTTYNMDTVIGIITGDVSSSSYNQDDRTNQINKKTN